MVWHVSVRGKLALSGAWVLSHQVAMVHVCDLELVLLLLVLFPRVLPVFLLSG